MPSTGRHTGKKEIARSAGTRKQPGVFSGLRGGLSVLLLMLASAPLQAATALKCSGTQSGKAVINEIQTQAGFVEIYLKSAADIKDWALYLDGSKVATLGTGTCKINDTANADNTSTGTTTTTWPAGSFIICDTAVNPSKGEILLVDKNTALATNNTTVIDYLGYGKLTGGGLPTWTVASACATLYPDHGASNKDIARIPDGTGSLSDNGDNNTKGKSNSGTPAVTVDHYEIDLPATGLTCQSSSIAVRACSSSTAPCTASIAAASITATLSASSGSFAAATQTFTGSGTYTLTNTSPATVTVAMTSPAVVPKCYSFDGTTRSLLASCAFEVKNAAFLFDVPNFSAGDGSGDITISAVRQDDTTRKCVSFVPSGSVKLWTTYLDPASGTKQVPLTYAGNTYALPTSKPGAGNVPLTFDANGQTTISLDYLDAGQLRLSAEWNAVTGQSDFVVKPYFALSGITCADTTANPAATGPAGNAFCRAGQSFSATVRAVTRDGTTSAPNFGREATPESVKLTAILASPTGGNAPALAGSLTKTADPSVASSTSLSWPEVGVISLTPGIADGSYLGAGDVAAGDIPKVGRFYPDHFDTSVIKVGNVPMDCPGSSASFTCPVAYNGLVYAGQPFSVRVTAKSTGGSTTLNYNGASNYARDIQLTAFIGPGSTTAPAGMGAGSLTGDTATADKFSSGLATLSTVAYTFTTAPGSATDIYLRARESTGTDQVSSLRSVAASSAEEGVKVAQGRIRLSNAFGTGRSSLDVPIEAQIWTGTAWVPNSKDATPLTTGAVGVSGGLTVNSLSYSNGRGYIRLAAPAAAGSHDVSLNLAASGGSAQSCASGLSASTAAGAPWLRSRHGCATTYNRDPSARATFGIYPPETEKSIHVRELY